jgi:hypothetical protein
MIGAPMRAQFHRQDEPDTVVGTARWRGRDVEVDAEDPKVRRALGRVYRRTAVQLDDPSLRPLGTSGPVSLAPGSLRWFVACTQSRTAAEKLGFRLAPDPAPRMGWDPAGAYRRFPDQVERAERLASDDEP